MPDSDHFSGQEKAGPCARRLAGKTVMLTRPPAQAAEMAMSLERLGAKVIHCPTIEVVAPDSWQPVDTAIARVESYDWLIFTSANGVEFFFRRLAEIRPDGLRAVSRSLICAIGPATARAIVAAGGHVDLKARDSIGEGLLAALIEAVGGKEKLAGLRFLLPRARVAREVLPAELARYGAQVDAIEAYQTIRPNVGREAMIRWITESRVDAIAFTSPSTVNNFAALLGVDDLAESLRGIIIASIGPVTSDALRTHGLAEIVQPQTYNATALVEALVQALTRG